MESEVPPGQAGTELSGLLTGLVEGVPHTRSAVLLSIDGLVTAAHGLESSGAEHLAALAAGLYGLARSAGARFGDSGDVRQVVVELDRSLLFVSSAGPGACLAVVAAREADPAVLGYAMATLVKTVRPALNTAPRQPAGQ